MENGDSNSDYSDLFLFMEEQLDIYREALPNYSDRIGLFLLDNQAETFAYNWIEKLFQYGKLNIELTENAYSSSKIKHIYFQSKNQERLEGQNPVGFGFPFYIKYHNDKLIAAPLFIWRMGLEPDQVRSDVWHVYRQDQPVIPNPFLLDFIDQTFESDWKEKFPWDSMRKLQEDNLLEFCKELAEVSGFSHPDQEVKAKPCPTVDKIGLLAENGVIYWSGVLGLFPTDYSTHITSEKEIKELFQPTTLIEEGIPFSYLKHDPFQETAFRKIFNNKFTIIGGDSGSGKTRLLTNTIINALSNEKKCLIISEKIPVLEKIQKELAGAGLQNLQFLIKNPERDKLLMKEMLKASKKASSVQPEQREDNFSFLLDKWQRITSKLDEGYEKLRLPILENDSWAEIAGQFMQCNRQVGKELLSSQLIAKDFQYDSDTYKEILSNVTSCQPLYQNIKTLKHSLRSLHPNNFVQKEKKESYQFIEYSVNKFLQKSFSLQRKFINLIDEYTEKLSSYYQEQFHFFAKKASLIKNGIAEFSNQFGTDFSHSSKNSLQFSSLFSRRAKNILKHRKEIQASFSEMDKLFQEAYLFDHAFQDEGGVKNILEINKSVAEFENELQKWQEKIPESVQEEVNRLSKKTVQEQLGYKEKVHELEYSIDNLIGELNETLIYRQELENKMLTIPKQQKFLEKIIEQLENTKYNLRDFKQFYEWERNWLQLGPNGQKVVTALVKVKAKDWQTAFKSWFLNNCLSSRYSPTLPTEKKFIDEVVELQSKIQALLPTHIKSRWQEIQYEANKSFRNEHKDTFLLFFGRKNAINYRRINLSSIIDGSFDFISSYFPVLLTTPAVAEKLFKRKFANYDLLLFEECPQLAVDRIALLAQLSNRVAFFTNPAISNNYLPLSQRAQEANIPVQRLKSSYKEFPLALFKMFKNEDRNISNVQFEQIDGRFDNKKGINEAEAQHVMHLLNQIEKTPQRTFPKVGIICGTVQQRNLIASYLLKIKQKRSTGSEKILQLERNGLGVFSLSETVGLYFDIVLFSATWGVIDLKATLTHKIGTLNSEENNNFISLLMSRAHGKLIILNSIPIMYLEKYLSTPENSGTFQFSCFLLLAESIQHKDVKRQETLLQTYHKHLGTEEKKALKNTFISELAASLQPYLERGRIQKNVQINGIPIPLIIQPINEGQSPLVIVEDGFFASAPTSSYQWEADQLNSLHEMGIETQAIYSVNWWKNPQQEARKLASRIIKMDNAYRDA
ncbi:MAG: hypothetical protein GY705_23530 [Bacteroidetes bacterium]|nr:hypothetical protein [Bacteroidota bacterium]